MINYRFLTTETNLKALLIYFFIFLHNLISKAVCCDCTDFFQEIFLYNCVFLETFHNLKMKTHFEKEPHFEIESSFQNPF